MSTLTPDKIVDLAEILVVPGNRIIWVVYHGSEHAGRLTTCIPDPSGGRHASRHEREGGVLMEGGFDIRETSSVNRIPRSTSQSVRSVGSLRRRGRHRQRRRDQAQRAEAARRWRARGRRGLFVMGNAPIPAAPAIGRSSYPRVQLLMTSMAVLKVEAGPSVGTSSLYLFNYPLRNEPNFLLNLSPGERKPSEREQYPGAAGCPGQSEPTGRYVTVHGR